MMKYVSPICEMEKIETVDIMEKSLNNIVPGAMFAGQTGAVDANNTHVTENKDEAGNVVSRDVSVGIDFSKLGTTTQG